MFNLRNLYLCFLSSTLFAGVVAAQPPPPPAKTESGTVKIVQQPSLKNLPDSEKFSSADGRFTVSLPQNISGFAALTPQNLGMKASGGLFQWRVREGDIGISYYDFHDEAFSVSTKQDFVNFFSGARDAVLNSMNAKLTSESLMTFGKYQGYKFGFQLPYDYAGIGRVIYADKRAYTLLAIVSKDAPEAESLISRAFDTFSLINQKDIDDEIKKQVEASTPQPLPQEAAAKKEKSDADDDGLKGKVKTVVEESEDLSGTWSTQGRHYDSIKDYNERGDRLKQVLYDSEAKPFQITVYGYIDGARVSSSNTIKYEYDPPPIMAVPSKSGENKKPRDTRYEYKFEYKYVGGKLAEKQLFYNDGAKGMRYVYNRKGNQVEELVYDDKGNLNQKYIYTLDEKGNEIERIDAAVLPHQKAQGDRIYSIKYESFDEKGNWTKRVTSKLATENGKQVYKPWYISYRTITYYS